MNLSDFSRKGAKAKSVAKTAANRAKTAVLREKVRHGKLPNPHRKKTYPKSIQKLTKRYLWWQTSDQSLAYPLRLIAQVMDIGTAADVVILEDYFGQEAMRIALQKAEPGWFRERSWVFWHYRLDLTPWGDEPPPLPIRTYVA